MSLSHQEMENIQSLRKTKKKWKPRNRKPEKGNGDTGTVYPRESLGYTLEEPVLHTESPVQTEEGISLKNYMVPRLRFKGKPNKKEKDRRMNEVKAFNDMLEDIGSRELYPGDFTVVIMVGDLKGFGDISAGAKLAAELSDFYSKNPGWGQVRVKLYLHKITVLRDDAKTKSDESKIRDCEKRVSDIERIVTSIISGTGAELAYDFDEIGDPAIYLGYPAHNAGGVDFTIAQYGYEQYGDGKNGLYGSGPGFGALGTILPREEKIEEAIAMAEGSVQAAVQVGPLVRAFREFCSAKNVSCIHFAYYSIYPDDCKEFVKEVGRRGITGNTAIAFAGDVYLKSLKDSLSGLEAKGFRIIMGEVSAEHGCMSEPDAGEGSDTDAPATIYLIRFADRLTQPEMMAMYYLSTGEVGATGDQSFMEAYVMRRRKAQTDTSGKTILYGVPDQQRELYRQILEIRDTEHHMGQETQGVKEIPVNASLDVMLDSKPLLMPAVMLINAKLWEKYPVERTETGEDGHGEDAAE